jgi:hypothetical protein
MNFEWNWKTIVVLSVVVLLFVGTNAGQYYFIWSPKQEKMKLNYEAKITALEAELKSYGDMINIWTVASDAKLYPGQTVEFSHLEPRQIPESLLNESFILEPETVVGKYYKIALTSGTPLSMDLVMDEPVGDTVREFDVVASIMPIGLKVGDYVDYRIVYPYGEDYIVLPHKRVEAIHDKTIKFKMSETEIHYYQAALIDYFLNRDKGTVLYMTKYVEPGLQQAATRFYAIPKNIEAILLADPNVIHEMDEVRENNEMDKPDELSEIVRDLNEKMREIIETGISNVQDEDGRKIQSGRTEIAGKIDSGERDAQDQEKVRQELEAMQQSGQQQPTDGGVSYAPERGVVE